MTESVKLCACGCGNPVRLVKYPNCQKQPKFIQGHQHKGTSNGNYKGGAVPYVCAVCGKQGTYKRGTHKTTCSQACYRKWVSLTVSARGMNKVTVQCAHCGKNIRKFPSQVKEANYCNRKCMGLARKELGHAEHNGNWRGGQEKFSMEQARMRDDYKCVICGFDIVTDVHHITPRAQGGTNEPTNLLTLCPNHHRMADLGIISVEHLRRLL